MALFKTVQLPNNFGEVSTFQNAYIKVDRIEIVGISCNATVNTYATKNGNTVASTVHELVIDRGGDNYVKQAYQFLKTLPEFSDATDC